MRPPQCESIGPRDAKIMVVGEAPGQQEVAERQPFVGQSGMELDRMLHDAGILRTECFLTNACQHQPPGNQIEKFYLDKALTVPGPELQYGIDLLKKDIENVRPNIVITLGNTPLRSLTGNSGIVKWRGSKLEIQQGSHRCKLIPTYHPAAVLRQWSWRQIAVHDLRQAGGEKGSNEYDKPEFEFEIQPSIDRALGRIEWLGERADRAASKQERIWLSGDIETRHQHISCVGIGWSETEAICFPFMSLKETNYWLPGEELVLLTALRSLFSHPNIDWIFQNGLFDLQYFIRYWGFVPNVTFDTMLAQHVLWVGLPKSLDFIASMYCKHYVYWKDDGKKFDPKLHSETQHWIYNCEDCVRTYEVAEVLNSQLIKLNQYEQFAFQMKQFWMILRMMIRGVRCNEKIKGELALELDSKKCELEIRLNRIIGQELNVRSHKQMKEFFYEDLGVKVIRSRKGKRGPTLDDKALQTIAKRTPVLKPVVAIISDIRSTGVFLSTFVNMSLDADRRIRCSYNPSGTETFRWNSSANAFGTGTNLQNIPEGDSDLPNCRRLFIPDINDTIGEWDLKGADAQVVAAEADDDKLRELFASGLDIHRENAKDIFGTESPTKDQVYLAKRGVHATNYLAQPRTLAAALGILVREAEDFQGRWFMAHPGIPEWHKRVEDSLRTTRSVSNVFGFRRYYFDRIEGVLSEAVAWIPQSTVAISINRGLVKVDAEMPDVEILLQVHDSGVMQWPEHLTELLVPQIHSRMLVVIPYPRPLTIPITCKLSRKSWGDCEKIDLESYREVA